MQEFKSDEVYSNLLENDDNKELLEICLFIYLINKKKPINLFSTGMVKTRY